MIVPEIHKVATVSDPREWQSKRGDTFVSFMLTFDGDAGSYEISRKPTSPAPTVGQMMDIGEVVPPNGNFPPKIKLAQANGSRPGGGRSPQETAQIVRQHSQEMALRYAAIKQSQGNLPAEFTPADLFKIAHLFDADAKGAKP